MTAEPDQKPAQEPRKKPEKIDHIIRMVADLASPTLPPHMADRARKNLVCLLWNDLPETYRREIYNRISVTDDFSMFLEPWPIEKILRWWTYVVRYGFTGWDGDFVRSVEERRKKWKSWRPSEKEEQHVRRLFQEAMFAQKVEVVE